MQHALPSQTTIQQPIAKLARAAVDLLLNRIESIPSGDDHSSVSRKHLRAPSPMEVKLLIGRTA